jgi:putative Mg2+ transporter-C (MgtC) family protein
VVPEITFAEELLRICLAAGLGAAVGFERELREHEAGLRTHMLVAVGSALFTLVSAYGFGEFFVQTGPVVPVDPTRIAAQIVTGIGFLGAGAIIRQGFSVRGLTTAAGLWVVAAIGMAAGAGYYSAALIGTGVVLVALGPLRWLEGAPLNPLRREGRALEVDLKPGRSIAPVLALLEEQRARVSRVQLEEDGDRRHLLVQLEFPPGTGHDVVDRLAALEDVIGVRLGG